MNVVFSSVGAEKMPPATYGISPAASIMGGVRDFPKLSEGIKLNKFAEEMASYLTPPNKNWFANNQFFDENKRGKTLGRPALGAPSTKTVRMLQQPTYNLWKGQ